MSLPITHLSLACLTLAVAGPVSAQDPPPQLPHGGSDVVVVEVAGGETGVARLLTDVDELPAAASALDADQLAARGARESEHALLAIPGVNVQTQSGIFGVFLIRGVDSLAGGAVLSDGVVEPEATRYPLYTVERVEVLRGPAGFAWGAGALAGAVNLVRERPYFRDFGGVSAELGSLESRRAELDLNLGDADEPWAFRASALLDDRDGWRPRTAARLTGIAPTATWRIDEGSALSIDLELLRSEAEPDAGLPILGAAVAPVDDETWYGTGADDSTQDITRFHVDYTRRLGAGSILRGKAYYHRLEWESGGTVLAGLQPTPFGLLLNRLRTELTDDQRFAGVQVELLAELGSESRVRHQLSTGIELARRDDDFALDFGVLTPVDPLAPVDSGAGVVFPLPHLAERGDARTLLASPWAIDQVRIGERLALWGGLRLDHLEYEDAAVGVDDSDTELSPLLGAVWQASENWRTWASVGRSFAPPSTRIQGDRQPETSEQIEVGVRFARSGYRAGLSLFRLDRANIAIPDFTGVRVTAGSHRADGLELELGADLAHGTRVSAWWTYTDAELTEFRELVQIGPLPSDVILVDRTGNTPAFTPRHLARIEVARPLPAGFDAALGARFIGAQFSAESNAVEIDDALLVDASVGWTKGRWRTALRLSNLTDEETFQRGQGDLSLIPADPFAARIEAGVRW